MVRPKKEGGALTAAQRQAKRLIELREAGGDKVCVMMPPETYQRLLKIMSKRGIAVREHAIILAVDELAKRVR